MDLQFSNTQLNNPKTRRKNKRRELLKFLTNISMFFLNQESMKGLIWSIKKVEYKPDKNQLLIGINAQEKLGTVLSKMRKSRAKLADYLYGQDLTQNRKAHIEFYVDREEEIVNQIYDLIDKVNQDQPQIIE